MAVSEHALRVPVHARLWREWAERASRPEGPCVAQSARTTYFRTCHAERSTPQPPEEAEQSSPGAEALGKCGVEIWSAVGAAQEMLELESRAN
jgi:hypothetical protein